MPCACCRGSGRTQGSPTPRRTCGFGVCVNVWVKVIAISRNVYDLQRGAGLLLLSRCGRRFINQDLSWSSEVLRKIVTRVSQEKGLHELGWGFGMYPRLLNAETASGMDRFEACSLLRRHPGGLPAQPPHLSRSPSLGMRLLLFYRPVLQDM